MHDFLYKEADGKCKWQQNEDHSYVCQDVADEMPDEEETMPA